MEGQPMTDPDAPIITPETQARWLRRIKALLAKAEGSDNEAEQDTYRSQAFGFAARYRIDLAKLQDSGEAVKDKIVHVTLDARKPFIQRLSLINAIAQVNGCSTVRLGKKSASIEVVEITGFESDVTLVRMLIASLSTQAERGFAAATIPYGVKPRTFRRGYWEMFTVAVARRMRATKEATTVQHGTAGTAIVLRDKSALVQEDIEFRYPELRKARRSSTKLGHGRREGYADGMRADLGTDDKVGHFHQVELEG
jgi:hypothetical protein